MALDAELESVVSHAVGVKVVVIQIHKQLNYMTEIWFCYFNRQQKTPKQPEPALSQGSKVRVRCTQCVCSGLERRN